MDKKQFIYDFAMAYAREHASTDDPLEFVEMFQRGYAAMFNQYQVGSLSSLDITEQQCQTQDNE